MTVLSTLDSKLRATCIITNYNYGAYLPQAVDSVLSQTIPFLMKSSSLMMRRLTISSVIISELAKRIDILKVFRQEVNAGQLAAFETGIMQSSGDIVFFLDADDVYSSDYLGIALAVYQKGSAM